MKKLTGSSNDEIGRLFGIGYTAVSETVRRFARDMSEDPKIRATVAALEIELLREE